MCEEFSMLIKVDDQAPVTLPGIDQSEESLHPILAFLKQRNGAALQNKTLKIAGFLCTITFLGMRAKFYAIMTTSVDTTNVATDVLPKNTEAVINAEVDPIILKINGTELVGIYRSRTERDKSFLLNFKFGTEAGVSFTFKGCVTCKFLFDAGSEADILFTKGPKKQPRLRIQVKFDIGSGDDKIELTGYLRVCMFQLPPLPANKLTNAIKPLADLCMVPRAIKLHLEVSSKNGIIQSLINTLKKAFTGIMDSLTEAMEAAERKLDEHTNIPVIGIFVKLVQCVIRAVRKLVELVKKGIDFVVGIVAKLVSSVIEIYHLLVSGELGGSEGLEVLISFHVRILGVEMKGGIHVRLKSLLTDIAKNLACWMLGNSSTPKLPVGDHVEDEDSDEDSYPHPTNKREEATISGQLDWLDKILKDAPQGGKITPEMQKKVDRMEALADLVEKKLNSRDIEELPPMDDPRYDQMKSQLENILTSNKPELPRTFACPHCHQIFPFNEQADHLGECKSFKLPCEFCQSTFSLVELSKHTPVCPKRVEKDTIQCSRKHCKAVLPKEKLQAHWDTECEGELTCSQCQMVVISKLFKDHLKKNHCRKTNKDIIVCKKCGDTYPAQLEPLHEKICGRIQCPHCKDDLPSKMDLPTHLPECRSDAKCEYCQLPVPAKRLQEHHDTLCLKIPLKCRIPECSQKLLPNNIDTPPVRINHHLQNECKWFKVRCSRCEEEVVKSKLDDHLANSCPMNCRECLWKGCHKKIDRRVADYVSNGFCGECTSKTVFKEKLPVHLQQNCPEFHIKCPFTCRDKKQEIKKIRRTELADHLQKDCCPKREFKCPTNGCKESFVAKEDKEINMVDHFASCVGMQCPYGCSKKDLIFKKDLRNHLNLCPKAHWRCPKCEKDTIIRLRSDHLLYDCEKFFIRCRKCSKEVLLKEEGNHLATSCEKNLTPCYYDECAEREIPLCRLIRHMDKDCQFHEVQCTFPHQLYYSKDNDDDETAHVKCEELNHCRQFHEQPWRCRHEDERSLHRSWTTGGNPFRLPLLSQAYLLSENRGERLYILNDLAQAQARQKEMGCDQKECSLCNQTYDQEFDGHHLAFECEGNITQCEKCEQTAVVYKDLNYHRLNECPESFYQCPVCFRDDILRSQQTNHLIYECGAERRFNCPYCNDRLKQSEIREHLNTCPEGNKQRVCDQCKKAVACKDFHEHSISDCAALLKCPYCHVKELPLAEHLEHFLTDCPEYTLPCYYCSTVEKPVLLHPKEYLIHLVLFKCDKYQVTCGDCDRQDVAWTSILSHRLGSEDPCSGYRHPLPFCCDRKGLLFAEFERHLLGEAKGEEGNGCEEYEIACDRKPCQVKIARKGMQHHLLHECEHNIFHCEECEEAVKEKDREKHGMTCKMVNCDQCQMPMLLRYLEKHKKDGCVKSLVPCPFSNQCKKVPEFMLADHKARCGFRKVQAHVKLDAGPHARTFPEQHKIRSFHPSKSDRHPGHLKNKYNTAEKVFSLGICAIIDEESYTCCGGPPGSNGCVTVCGDCGQHATEGNSCKHTCLVCHETWTDHSFEREECFQRCVLCCQDVAKVEECMTEKCSACQKKDCGTDQPGCRAQQFNMVDIQIKARRFYAEIPQDITTSSTDP